MKKTVVFAFAAAIAMVAGTAPAQYYATGSFTTPAFSPGTGTAGGGTAADLAGFDDGSHGDAVAGDGIFTTTVTGLTPGTNFDWKWATAGFASSTPDCGFDNAKFTVPSSGTVKFFRDTNLQGDGFVPENGVAPTGAGIPYTDALDEVFAAATTIKAVGSFQTVGFDVNGADAVLLTDTGNGDAAGNDIYVGTGTGYSAGSKDFKVVINSAFNNPGSMSNGGYTGGCGNLSFTVLNPSDIIVFTVNARTGRVRAFNSSAIPGPPFFAQSSAWGEAYTSTENMGAAVDGVYRKAFVVATAGDYTVRVRQGVGPSYPDTGNYPFTTTTPNQSVLVVFDKNTYSDPYYPQTEIVAVVNAADKAPLNTFSYVQPVGQWQSGFGSTDYNADVAAMAGFDDGQTATSGDVTAGDGVFAVKLTELDNVGGTNENLKAVGRRQGTADSGFTIQLGGPDDGLTISGNNSQSQISYTALQTLTFQMDTVTGRVGIGATKPQRAAIFDPGSPAAATSWDLYN